MATFENDKALAKYNHFLEIWRIIIDKLIIGVIIILLYCWGDSLLADFKQDLNFQRFKTETLYKDETTHRRFLFENRLKGVQELRDAYSHLSKYFTVCCLTPKPEDKKQKEAHKEMRDKYNVAIDKFIEVSNRWNLLFSDDVNKSINHHTWIHSGIVSNAVEINKDHYEFAVEIFYHFDNLTKRAFCEEALGEEAVDQKGEFSFVEWDSKKASTTPGHKFFEENYKKWKSDTK